MSISQHDRAILNRIFSQELPYNDVLAEENGDLKTEEENDNRSAASKQLEVEGVSAAEKGELSRAIDLFSQAIIDSPAAASGYNNRAQALRLKGDVDGALIDLCKAIELSEGKGKVASLALTQRATIRRLRGEDADALTDFKQAAALGNEFARRMVVALNPYAALCNQMMSEIMERECRGYTGQ